MKKKLAGVLVLSMLAGSIGSLPAETFAKGTEGQEVFSVSDNVAWLGGWEITPQTELAGMTISDSKKEELIARLEDGIRNRQSSIDISDLYCDKPIVAAAIPEMLNRNPDFFYVDGWFSTNSGGTDYVRTVFPKYCVRYPEGSSAEFEAAVQGYMDEIDPSWNDYEKALYLHDALCRDMEYDDDLERHNAYNALVEHYGVCVSYATGYTVLCRAAGIPCDYVVSRNGEHCWNIITIGGKKYYVDCTWDDKPGKFFRHTYFLNSRDKFGHDSKYDKNNNLIDTTDWATYYDSDLYLDTTGSTDMDSSWVSKVEGPVVMRKNAGGSSEYYYLQTGGSNDPNIYRSSSLKEKGAVVGTMTGYDDWWCSMMASYGDDIYIGTGAAIFKMDASHNVSLFHVVTEEEKEDPLGNQWGDKLRLFGISVSGDVLSYDMKLYPEDSDRVGGHAIRLTDGTFFAPTATPTPATWLADVGTPTPTPCGGNNTTVTPTPTKGATATPIPADYPDWTEGVNYQVGDIVTYQGKTYRCTRAIPGQAGWDPVTLLGSYWEEYDAPAPTAMPTVTNTPMPTATSTPVPTATSTPTPTPTWAFVVTGWFNDGEGWMYFDNGDVVTGWVKSGGKWYSLSKETGYMQTGWIKDGGKWYFLDKKTGAMKTGWIKDGSAWYHTDKNGVMQSSKWISDGGKWYYVGSNGKMVTGKTITIGGVSYTFDKNGVWIG